MPLGDKLKNSIRPL